MYRPTFNETTEFTAADVMTTQPGKRIPCSRLLCLMTDRTFTSADLEKKSYK